VIQTGSGILGMCFDETEEYLYAWDGKFLKKIKLQDNSLEIVCQGDIRGYLPERKLVLTEGDFWAKIDDLKKIVVEVPKYIFELEKKILSDTSENLKRERKKIIKVEKYFHANIYHSQVHFDYEHTDRNTGLYSYILLNNHKSCMLLSRGVFSYAYAFDGSYIIRLLDHQTIAQSHVLFAHQYKSTFLWLLEDYLFSLLYPMFFVTC
jgi:hypothetical protein